MRASAVTARAIRAGLAGIAAYKLRTGLMVLGIVIGVCGVLTISAFGQIAGGLTAESLAQFGTTLISISAAPVAGGHTVLPAHLPPNSSLGTAWLPSPGATILALLVSILTGMAFGTLPARHAASLDPVTALHTA